MTHASDIASELAVSVRHSIEELGILETFQSFIERNNTRILGPDLDNGCLITRERTAIHDAVMRYWAEREQTAFGYKQPFAVVALGGTGREEITPCSDKDYVFLFDDTITDNKFLKDLQEKCLHHSIFKKECGFSGEFFPYNLDDLYDLEGKQLNAFLDMRAVYDPCGLTQPFRERIRENYDRFEHFLHVSKPWRDRWGKADSKNEQLDHYEIKADGLRIYLAGIWTLAGKDFRHSHEIYRELKDPRSLEAYYFLLRIRSFIHLLKGTQLEPTAAGFHPEDAMGFTDFMSLDKLVGEEKDEQARFEFANEIRSRFLTARKRVDQFTWGVIGRELKEGRKIRQSSAIVYGSGGLRDTAIDREGEWEKSRAALSVLLASQRYGLPIDPFAMETTFRDAGDWLVPVPELAELFRETKGSLADSLKFLAQIPNAEARLFPGYDRFETSIDDRVLSQKKCLRGALVREKLRLLENEVTVGRQLLGNVRNTQAILDPESGIASALEAALLDDLNLAAIRLAIKTKRLPVVPDDLEDRKNPNLKLHVRYSSGFSGIAVEDYYRNAFAHCHFADEVLDLTAFLVTNRGAFKKWSSPEISPDLQVIQMRRICDDDESKVRALYVFTKADRSGWKSSSQLPMRWFNIDNLYERVQIALRPELDPSVAISKNFGFDRDQVAIIDDFGKEFLNGCYRISALTFSSYLFKLKEDAESEYPQMPPRVRRIHIGTSEILAVAARDYPGIAASICGAFSKLGVNLEQARLFSAPNHGLALDFFHLATPRDDTDLCKEISAAIIGRLYISDQDLAAIESEAHDVILEQTSADHYRLLAETSGNVGDLIYFLTAKAYRILGANIHGMSAHGGSPGRSRASIYLSLPDTMEFDRAREQVLRW